MFGFQEPVISVIIPCFNEEKTLADQLSALGRQTFQGSYEVILVDNGSTDGSVAIAQNFQTRTGMPILVRAPEHRGAGYARNVGAIRAQADFLLFCDADDIVGDQWIEAMMGALERSSLVGGPLDWQRLNPPWHPNVRRRIDIQNPHYHGISRIPAVGAGNMGIHKSLFEQLGGFDSDMLVHEDSDLCLRAHKLGHCVHLCEEAVVYARARTGLRATYRQAQTLGFWCVFLDKKHLDSIGMPPVLRPLLGWPYLPLRLASVRRKGDFTGWVYSAGWKVGRLAGCLRTRFFAP